MIGAALLLGLAGCGGGNDAGPQPSPGPLTSTPSATPTPSRTTAPPTTPPTTPPPTVTPTRTTTPTKTPTPAPSSTALPADLAGHVVWRIPTSRHVVALTFDGGSGSQGASSVVRSLGDADIPATFFLTGRFVQSYPAVSRTIAASYVVGNHTMTHPHLNQLSSDAVRAEVNGDESVARAAFGRTTKPWFRFPFGEYTTRTLAVVNDLGYAGIGWTIDTLGWEGRGGAGTVDDIIARVVGKLQPGAIVLMHLGAAPDGSTLDADALPRLITAIRHAGYGFATVQALL